MWVVVRTLLRNSHELSTGLGEASDSVDHLMHAALGSLDAVIQGVQRTSYSIVLDPIEEQDYLLNKVLKDWKLSPDDEEGSSEKLSLLSKRIRGDRAENIEQAIDIDDIGNIIDGYGFCRQQYGAKDLKCLIFGTLRSNFSRKAMTAFNGKIFH